MSNNMDSLPPEILLHIFRFLPTRSLLLSATPTCSRWRQLIGCEVANGRLANEVELDPAMDREEMETVLGAFNGARKVKREVRIVPLK